MAPIEHSRCILLSLLIVAINLLPAGAVHAWQSPAPLLPPPPPLVFVPAPDAQFQQVVRLQQTTDQLQKSQLEQQLHQAVADQARLPSANNPALQQQLSNADQAQRNRDRAARQDLIDRYRSQATTLPRVIPENAPVSSRSGG